MPPAPALETCCTHCLLRRGVVVAETLEHFVVHCPLHAARRRVWRAALPPGPQGAVWQPEQWLRAALDLSAVQQGGASGRRATLAFWSGSWAARGEIAEELQEAAAMASVIAGIHGPPPPRPGEAPR